jgi:hypothetical protein
LNGWQSAYHGHHWRISQKNVYKLGENAVKFTSTSINNNQMKFTLLLISALSLAANAANLVKDHRFAHLGHLAIYYSAFSDAWEDSAWKVIDTSSEDTVILTSNDVVGRTHWRDKANNERWEDKYDVYLKGGRKMSQVFTGLTQGRNYLMRIRVIANPECKGEDRLQFGVVGGEGRVIESDPDSDYYADFSKGVYHQITFVASAATEHEIFIWSRKTIASCKGPLIREVMLNAI